LFSDQEEAAQINGHDSPRWQGGVAAMSRFLIELKHENEALACARAVKMVLATGSHFLTNADWGCMDGEHTAWIIVEFDTKEQARSILPPAYRSQAKIVALNGFSMEQVDELIGRHQG
jgi:hypothetical protein